MPEYSEYRVNNRTINDILEYSTNRQYIVPFKGFNHNNSDMAFAAFVQNVHPFAFDTKINEYYSNNNSIINKGCAAKGYAPILNIAYETTKDDGNKEIIIRFKGTGNPLDMGMLEITKDNKTTEIECPTCIILGTIGAGGGGAGGGGYYTGKESFGGGCGALLVTHIELPYKNNYYTNVLRINLGEGGKGGAPWKDGDRGGDTTVEFWDFQNNEWVIIALIYGGREGQIYPINNDWGESTDLAITKLRYTEFNGIQGYGRITIADSIRNWTWGSGYYYYMPGNYYDRDIDDSYNQSSNRFGPLTSGRSLDYSSIQADSYSFYNPELSYTAYSGFAGSTKNVWWTGKNSVYGQGGSVSGSSSGGRGGVGAGGGAGCKSTNIFDSDIGSGGRGGPAGFKIYW